MNSTNTALDQALAQAEAAAGNFQAPVVQDAPATTAVANYSKPDLDSFASGGAMAVDAYLRIKTEGLRIGDDMKGLVDDMLVEIDMLDVTPVFVSRHEVGGSTTFIKSYDGQTTSTGENFQAAVAARSRVPGSKNSGVYRTVEIPCSLVEDVKDPKSSLVFDAGTMVGLTPSMTGFSEFQRFYKKLKKQDESLVQQVLQVKLAHKKRTNSKNNEWGVIEFELVEALG